ncbi:MAG: VOC family protein [Xanthomonadales bacterium]|nr:VOC family protein [Xanthomonadales bacterium]
MRFIILTLLVSLIGSAHSGTLSPAAKEMAAVPVNSTATDVRYQGKVIWHELITSDARLAGDFYEKMFSWKLDYKGSYTEIFFEGKAIGGMIEIKPKNEQGAAALWIPSISVKDVDKAVAAATQLGGKTLKPATDLDKRGRAALIADPDGRHFAVLSTLSGDPLDAEASFNSWLWDEVWSNNMDSSEAFYTDLFGYDQVAEGNNYRVLLAENKWRMGIRKIENEKEYSLWVPVIRVRNIHASTRQVEPSGGKVLLSPAQTPGDGKAALISDPTGALLLIQEWQYPANRGEQ